MSDGSPWGRNPFIWTGGFVVCVAILAGVVSSTITWGDYRGVSGESWLRLWGSLLAPVLLGTTASLAAYVAWRSLRQSERAHLARDAWDRRSDEHDRRTEFWNRLSRAVELGTSEEAKTALIGLDMLAFIYHDMDDPQTAGGPERDLLETILHRTQAHTHHLMERVQTESSG